MMSEVRPRLETFPAQRTALPTGLVQISNAKPPLIRHHFKMFTARATTSKATTSEMASSAIIISFIHGRIAETSVGLNAVAVANEKWK